MNRSLAHEITENLPWLLTELHLVVTEDHYDSEHFGNSVATLGSAQILVRFVKDRGLVSTWLASPNFPNEWWLLDQVLEVVCRKPVEITDLSLEDSAAIVRERFADLTKALGADYARTRDEIQKHAPQRLTRALRYAREKRLALEKED